MPSLSVNEYPINQSVKIKNYPNPFKNQTTIEYELSQAGNVSLSLIDVNGRLLKRLFAGQKQKGKHSFQLNSLDLSTGIYLVKLQMENTTNYIKIIKE